MIQVLAIVVGVVRVGVVRVGVEVTVEIPAIMTQVIQTKNMNTAYIKRNQERPLITVIPTIAMVMMRTPTRMIIL